jgi:hypothetical protein
LLHPLKEWSLRKSRGGSVLAPGEIDEAREWLEGREWHLKPGFEEAWGEIERALSEVSS